LVARESFDPEAKKVMGFRRSAPTVIQSVAAAVTTMLLVFHQMGLGAVWLVSPIQAKKEIETILKVPPTMALVCLVAVGILTSRLRRIEDLWIRYWNSFPNSVGGYD